MANNKTVGINMTGFVAKIHPFTLTAKSLAQDSYYSESLLYKVSHGEKTMPIPCAEFVIDRLKDHVSYLLTYIEEIECKIKEMEESNEKR